MEQETVTFKVKLRPKFKWVDQIYLGNMLIEALGLLSRQTSAFDFEIEAEGGGGPVKQGEGQAEEERK